MRSWGPPLTPSPGGLNRTIHGTPLPSILAIDLTRTDFIREEYLSGIQRTTRTAYTHDTYGTVRWVFSLSGQSATEIATWAQSAQQLLHGGRGAGSYLCGSKLADDIENLPTVRAAAIQD